MSLKGENRHDTSFTSLVAPRVATATTCGAASAAKVGITTTCVLVVVYYGFYGAGTGDVILYIQNLWPGAPFINMV